MPIVLDWNIPHLLHIHYNDVVNGEEFLESTLNLSGDSRFDDLRAIICNWSKFEISHSCLSVEDIEKAAAFIRVMTLSNPRIKLGTVLMNQGIEQRGAFASLFEMLTEDIKWKVASFNTLAELQTWLKQVDNVESAAMHNF